MSNEFDKEVAAKIADRAIAEARKESEEKYGKGLEEAWNDTYPEKPELDYTPIKDSNLIFYKNFQDLKDGNIMIFTIKDNDIIKCKPEELSKIDFYRQKVQQYEAVENLMESIEYEINNAQDSQILLKSDYYSDDDVLYHTYQNMIDAYKKCYGILEEVLKDI